MSCCGEIEYQGSEALGFAPGLGGGGGLTKVFCSILLGMEGWCFQSYCLEPVLDGKMQGRRLVAGKSDQGDDAEKADYQAPSSKVSQGSSLPAAVDVPQTAGVDVIADQMVECEPSHHRAWIGMKKNPYRAIGHSDAYMKPLASWKSEQ